jgi:hypothetical protein
MSVSEDEGKARIKMRVRAWVKKRVRAWVKAGYQRG